MIFTLESGLDAEASRHFHHLASFEIKISGRSSVKASAWKSSTQSCPVERRQEPTHTLCETVKGNQWVELVRFLLTCCEPAATKRKRQKKLPEKHGRFCRGTRCSGGEEEKVAFLQVYLDLLVGLKSKLPPRRRLDARGKVLGTQIASEGTSSKNVTRQRFD